MVIVNPIGLQEAILCEGRMELSERGHQAPKKVRQASNTGTGDKCVGEGDALGLTNGKFLGPTYAISGKLDLSECFAKSAALSLWYPVYPG
ncbi:hypothetical protein [Phyllobacterium chamaecytisi]|uniref:hypothetical protein n=1 Tax=Phyllobacterium chamaecytisi TaxID=2876082 RepID=UPI001CCEF0DD|nr:hypothetical protein [Phyllobacterium sp. KW56]MBZ9605571.1 hypothetical protein [Phyllobacterium sp. KW56]